MINNIKKFISKYKLMMLLLLGSIFLLLIKGFHLDNDIWFIFNHGRYVLSNGFPYIEPFTIHEGFKFVMQQWLSAVIYYSIYKYLGVIGVFIFTLLINYLITLMLYKLCYLISNNHKLSFIIALAIDFLLTHFGFIVTRPQIITYLVLIIFTYLIEYYIKTGKNKVLLFLPVISILEINLHMSMWWMLIIICLPFICYMLFEKYIKHQKENYSSQLFIITFSIVFLCGFLNPYKLDGVLYLFKSTNNNIVNFILEMYKPGVFDPNFLFCYLIFFMNFVAYLFFYKKYGKINVAYLLLLFGMFLFSLMAIKSLPYFYIFGMYPLAYYFKDLKIKKKIKIPYKEELIKYAYLAVFMVFITSITFLIDTKYSTKLSNYQYFISKGTDYLISKYDKKDIKAFCSYMTGGYLEYRGIKVYIDPRAEVFYKKMNTKKDVFDEYYELEIKNSNIDDFINKYKFTHLILTKDDTLYQKFKSDKYVLDYEEKGIVKIYTLKSIYKK
jgi:hypothetical protein